MPGRIIQSLRKVGVSNPVFMLDEIDKLGRDIHGDPASSLLEVLDPEQNNAFSDHYIELDYDLSNVFFIATANVEDAIPAPLRDRMEIIRLSGYTAAEKREIARRHLFKRQCEECGISRSRLAIRVSAFDAVIDNYTREAGVRELERVLASLLRKIARGILDGKYPEENGRIVIDDKLVRELLGPAKYLKDECDFQPPAGCSNGLAWTGYGGAVLTVEAIRIPNGKGELKLTGSLGNVMKESAEAAFTVVRCMAEELDLPEGYFDHNNFHIHVPDGATPKDGPSAGLALVTALWSLITGKPMAADTAMTGEITLRGRVEAIGGLREKSVAALRAGLHKVIIPKANFADISKFPAEISRKLTFIPVASIDEAFPHLFPDAKTKALKGRKK
jgi:ATP-dependent Lon protease